jgi:lipid A 3-O-deacylase
LTFTLFLHKFELKSNSNWKESTFINKRKLIFSMKSYLIYSIFTLSTFLINDTLFSQNLASTQTRPPQYIRLKVENDMLTPRVKTDRYFTSGLKLDYIFMKNPQGKPVLSNIFIRTKNGDHHLGVTFASNMYTPDDKTGQIVKGDRPFAGWAYAGIVGISNEASTGTRFTSEYSIGAIGPVTQQKYMQRQMHKIISRPEVKGWENQIANDIALNLSFTGEKRLMKPSDNVDLMGIVETNVGTVSNYMGVGSMIRIGWFDDYFKNIYQLDKYKKWQLFAYAKPSARIVADNSLLQGGIINFAKSKYTIPQDDLKRFYAEMEFGYGLSYRNFNFTYSLNMRTPEFKDAKNMYWGAVNLTYGL